MSKILLISANTTVEPYPVYPLGLSYVAGAARAQGHDVLEWDLLFNNGSPDELQKLVQSQSPDVIGLSLRNVDTVNYNKPESYTAAYANLVRSLKQIRNVPVVLGGSAYTIFPQELLNETGADYGIVGEGEHSFCNLLDQLESGWPPAGKIIYPDASLSGDGIRMAGRHPGLADFYLNKGGMLNVQTKRGCPHRCAYCSYPHLEGKRYRFRSKHDVVDEIQALIEKYHCDYYSITDSVFNDAQGNYLHIAEEIARRNISVPWMCFMRPQKFSKDEVQLLKRAGLSSVEFGADSSSNATLKGMQKDFSWDEVVHSNEMFAAGGIPVAHFIIFGGPGESEDTASEGLKNIAGLNNCVIFGGLGVRIFPHTPIYQTALKEGALTSDQNLLEPVFYFSKNIDADKLHHQILESFAGRSDRIYPDGQFVEKTSALHLFGHRGPAWDLLLKKDRMRRRRL
jgi:radical SAM superfamily enzyme YgiQ (UPF0313 family)